MRTMKGMTAVTRLAEARCMVETIRRSSMMRSLTGALQLRVVGRGEFENHASACNARATDPPT